MFIDPILTNMSSSTMTSTCSGENHQCEICQRSFESYMVFVKDDFTDITEWQKRKELFDHLCEWCNSMYFEKDFGGKRELAEEYSDKEV